MLMVVALALRRAFVADPRAQLQHFAKNLLIGAGPPHRELPRGFANVGAVEADADALPHVPLLGRAGIGAAEAHPRALHPVLRRIAEWLVDGAGHVGVEGDHLADGHVLVSSRESCGEPVRALPVPLVMQGNSQ